MSYITLLLVKHGETTEGKRGVILGHKGGTLSPKGKKEIEVISKRIKKIVDGSPKKIIIVSSDLKRAAQSAQIIRKAFGAPIVYNALLRERGAGVAEGKRDSKIDWKSYEEKPLYSRKHAGGESFSDVQKRARRFLQKIRRNKSEYIIIVSHSVTLAMLQSILKKRSIQSSLKNISYLEIVRIKK